MKRFRGLGFVAALRPLSDALRLSDLRGPAHLQCLYVVGWISEVHPTPFHSDPIRSKKDGFYYALA